MSSIGKINLVPPYFLAAGLMLVGAGGLLTPHFVDDLLNPAASGRIERINRVLEEIERGDRGLQPAEAANLLQADLALIESQRDLIRSSVELTRALGMVTVVLAVALFEWTRRMPKRVAPPPDLGAKTQSPIE